MFSGCEVWGQHPFLAYRSPSARVDAWGEFDYARQVLGLVLSWFVVNFMHVKVTTTATKLNVANSTGTGPGGGRCCGSEAAAGGSLVSVMKKLLQG
jgi:hypothetical protein